MQEKTVDRWLSIQSVSETLGCGHRFVYYLIQQGSLKAMKLGGRALRISEQSLQGFIESRIVNPDDYFAPVEPDPDHEVRQKKQSTKVARSNWMNR